MFSRQSKTLPGLLGLLSVLGLLLASTPAAANECVVFLHGLARTEKSMVKIEREFRKHGFITANIRYPSRRDSIEELTPVAVEKGISHCNDERAVKIHFVTHSLGGILVRVYLESNRIDRLGRIVMLAPPNQGSEVVDNFRRIPGYKLLNGPAGLQLGTDENSIPRRLGPVSVPVGVIAGTKTINPILSQSLPNPDDGKVSVEHTKVDGMADFIAMPVSHPFIMRSEKVIAQALHFIQTGGFEHSSRTETAAGSE